MTALLAEFVGSGYIVASIIIALAVVGVTVGIDLFLRFLFWLVWPARPASTPPEEEQPVVLASLVLVAFLVLLAAVCTASVARADVRLPPPPPPPPPPGVAVAQIAAGSALGFAVMALGLWLARRNRKVVAA